MKQAVIGKAGNKNIGIDLAKLMRTRLLIQANSGGGKSYLIRKLLEETHGKVQHIVLDLEGEFATLREKFDYLLVGKEGDIPADIRSAELLAKKLLEHSISAIIDLYELRHHERILFVKRFLDAMVNARKELWHPVLVIVDEAHIFCPEKTKSESASSVIDLATRGRKRGYCAALATQRLSKLHKDAAAECNNKLIGRTGLDVDMKRASEELGFTSKQQMLSLRDLDAGEFFAFGPAIAKQITKVKIDKVKTRHPEPGMGISIKPAPATKNIRLILSKLVDLPKKADEELLEKEDLRKKIRELKLELRKGSTVKYSKVPEIPDKSQLEKAKQQAAKETERTYKVYTDKLLRKIKEKDVLIKQVVARLSVEPDDLPKMPEPKNYMVPYTKKDIVSNNTPSSITPSMKVSPSIGVSIDEGNNGTLRAGAMKMLKAVAMFHPKPISRQQVASLSGFSVRGGAFGTYWGELRRAGWIEEKKGEATITNEGLENAGEIPDLPTEPTALVDMWASKFRRGAGAMLRVIAEVYPNEITREEIGEKTNFAPGGGAFGTYLGELRRNGLIEVDGQMVKASKTLFLEDL